MLRKNFFTGLVILFPIAITFLITRSLINLLTSPFLDMVKTFFADGSRLDSEAVLVVVRLLILAALAGGTIAIGMAGQLYIVKPLFAAVDTLTQRIPGINRLYKAIQETVSALLSSESPPFSSVVLVPFPHSASYSIGFITNQNDKHAGQPPAATAIAADKIAVFVPGAPNPMAGFLLLCDPQELRPLDIKVDDALKFIVSCGLIVAFTPTDGHGQAATKKKPSHSEL
jgi:uncharacterized membrane protein